MIIFRIVKINKIKKQLNYIGISQKLNTSTISISYAFVYVRSAIAAIGVIVNSYSFSNSYFLIYIILLLRQQYRNAMTPMAPMADQLQSNTFLSVADGLMHPGSISSSPEY